MMDSCARPRELGRLVAIATSRAAEALALLLCDEIQIKGLGVYYVHSRERLLTRLKLPRRLVAITQSIEGDKSARLSLALSHSSAHNLAALLVGRRTSPHRKLDCFELDALRETANVVAGSYLGLLGRPLGLAGAPSAPAVIEGTPQQMALSLLPQSRSLCVETHIMAPSRQVQMLLMTAVQSTHGSRRVQDHGSDGCQS